MDNDLVHQQKLLWELFKAWVNNHNQLDKDSQAFEVNALYERLSRFLNTEIKPVINHTSIAGPMLDSIDKEFPSVIHFITDVVGPERICSLARQAGADGLNYADLLVVIPESHPQAFPEIETLLNFACLKHHRLSCSIVKSSFFDRMIREGHIYYSLACNPTSLVMTTVNISYLKLDQISTRRRLSKRTKHF